MLVLLLTDRQTEVNRVTDVNRVKLSFVLDDQADFQKKVNWVRPVLLLRRQTDFQTDRLKGWAWSYSWRWLCGCSCRGWPARQTPSPVPWCTASPPPLSPPPSHLQPITKKTSPSSLSFFHSLLPLFHSLSPFHPFLCHLHLPLCNQSQKRSITFFTFCFLFCSLFSLFFILLLMHWLRYQAWQVENAIGGQRRDDGGGEV